MQWVQEKRRGRRKNVRKHKGEEKARGRLNKFETRTEKALNIGFKPKTNKYIF